MWNDGLCLLQRFCNSKLYNLLIIPFDNLLVILTTSFVFDEVVQRRFPVCEIQTGCDVSPFNRNRKGDDMNLHYFSNMRDVHLECTRSVEIEIFIEVWGV